MQSDAQMPSAMNSDAFIILVRSRDTISATHPYLLICTTPVVCSACQTHSPANREAMMPAKKKVAIAVSVIFANLRGHSVMPPPLLKMQMEAARVIITGGWSFVKCTNPVVSEASLNLPWYFIKTHNHCTGCFLNLAIRRWHCYSTSSISAQPEARQKVLLLMFFSSEDMFLMILYFSSWKGLYGERSRYAK